MFFIPGRFPHAIGPGVFMLEVQEPTDWVVQPERFIGNVALSQTDMWGPLPADVGLKCFHYGGAADLQTTLRNVRLVPKEVRHDVGGRLLEIIDATRTGCFDIRKLELCGEFTFPGGGYVGIVNGSAVELRDSQGRRYVAGRGQSFFVPAAVTEICYASEAASDVYFVRRCSG